MDREKENRKLTSSPHIVLIAGEKSGDEIGAHIIKALRQKDDSIQFSGSAGPSMRREGCNCWERMESFQVMGLFDVLKKLPSIFRAKKRLLQSIEEVSPDIILFIDQPSFSIHMAKKIRRLFEKKKEKVPLLLQVVAPSVWAYKSQRAKKIQSTFDALFLLYQFELPYFVNLLPTYWIGHISMEYWRKREATFSAQRCKKDLIALYPGSRPKEIRRNLSFQLQVAKETIALLASVAPFSIAIQCTDALSFEDQAYMIQEIEKENLQANVTLVPFSERYLLMEKASGALAKSGTVTLELALAHTPTVVLYKIGYLTKIWAKKVLKISPNQKFALPNIITKKEIFPEYIEEAPSVETVAKSLALLIKKGDSGFSVEDRNLIYDTIFPSFEDSPANIAATHILDCYKNRYRAS